MKNRFIICSIIKDEHLYLKEWIDYHLSIGFEKILLYEDFTSQSHESITKNYPQIELHSMSEIPGCVEGKTGRQIAVYNYILENINKGWILFIDIDEYLRFEDGYNLDYLVKSHENDCGLMLWWKCYGANGHVDRPMKNDVSPVQESYSDDFLENWNPCWQFKSFVNSSVAFTYKSQQSHFINCHYHKRIVSVDGQRGDFRQTINKKLKSYKGAWIDHYISKSWEDYLFRLKRGNITKGIRKVDSFFSMNPSMLPLKEKLTRNLDFSMFPTI